MSKFAVPIVALLAGILMVLYTFGLTFNEPGYQTHIRTITGHESVVTEVGYAWKGFGKATSWKQAQSVVFHNGGEKYSDLDGQAYAVEGYRVTFLGTVDAAISATTRFRLPTGEKFMQIAREYRTPENFYNNAIIPAIKETMQSTASLMTADDYFAGARGEFSNEFKDQLENGIFIIDRQEQTSSTRRGNVAGRTTSSTGLMELEDAGQSQFLTVKRTNSNGDLLRKIPQYIRLGVLVEEASVTNVAPNNTFMRRMEDVQKKMAELVIARQDRLKEEEAKRLATARGEKEVEQRRMATLRDQIEETTKAETSRQLAVIEATRDKERAEIEKITVATQLETARLEAQKITTLADAEAHARKVTITADGALQMKLEAMKAINAQWAEAFSKAPVPYYNMGGASGDGTGRQGEAADLMQLLTAKTARDLHLDLQVK